MKSVAPNCSLKDNTDMRGGPFCILIVLSSSETLEFLEYLRTLYGNYVFIVPSSDHRPAYVHRLVACSSIFPRSSVLCCIVIASSTYITFLVTITNTSHLRYCITTYYSCLDITLYNLILFNSTLTAQYALQFGISGYAAYKFWPLTIKRNDSRVSKKYQYKRHLIEFCIVGRIRK